jgi:hypothetical protein
MKELGETPGGETLLMTRKPTPAWTNRRRNTRFADDFSLTWPTFRVVSPYHHGAVDKILVACRLIELRVAKVDKVPDDSLELGKWGK